MNQDLFGRRSAQPFPDGLRQVPPGYDNGVSNEQPPQEKKKEPLFRFSGSDSAAEIAAKLNHNFDCIYGNPEEAGPGTYTRESIGEYHTRKMQEAFREQAEQRRRQAEEAQRNAQPSYQRQNYGDRAPWDAGSPQRFTPTAQVPGTEYAPGSPTSMMGSGVTAPAFDF